MQQHQKSPPMKLVFYGGQISRNFNSPKIVSTIWKFKPCQERLEQERHKYLIPPLFLGRSRSGHQTGE